MQINNIYEEKIFSKWVVIIMIIITAGLLFILVYQILVKPIDINPPPSWFYLFMFLLFILFIGITINFSNLNIKMTSQVIVVSYGIFKHSIPWENIEDCYLDEISGINKYSAGIQIDKIKGKWRLEYTVIGGHRVVISLRKTRFFKEFVFSTKNSEQIIKLIKQQS